MRAVRHVRGGAAATPVWLYSTAAPPDAVAGLCDRVVVHPRRLRLLAAAQRELWPLRAALAVGSWQRGGSVLLKLSPFFVPPFRTLFLNGNGDFLPGTPAAVATHWRDVVRERTQDARARATDWWDLARFHVWRSEPLTRAKDRVLAAGLFAAAMVLRACGYPQRRLFARVHGNASLDVSVPAASRGRGTVVYRQRGDEWDGPAVARLARESGARWLVWCAGEEDAPALDDLLPLFDDADTFAVSRQRNYRAWKPVLLPTAPFRALAPGEYTRVLAPLGSTVVVDLAKLAALGVPEVSLPLEAWMLLFWKAAAAGWKCYSAGQEKPLAPQPDLPVEETAFFLRVAADARLRALGPRDALLARGNIAFSVRPRGAPNGARPKVLVVSPFLPYPLSHGGAVRIYNLCRALAARVDFALIAVREHGETVQYDKLHEVFGEVRIVDIDQTASVADEIPGQARQHECPALRACIAAMCREWRPDLVQFEYTHTAALRDAAAGVPAILVEHDITYSLYRQLAGIEPSRRARREYRRWLEFENRWLARYEGVWTVSESDRALAAASSGRDAARTYAIANGVDTERFQPGEAPVGASEVLYVGSFRHLPNILAFERLRNEIMPLVWRRFPETVLRVVAGPRHDYFWERLERGGPRGGFDPRIRLHDFVEDLRPLYRAASVVVVPLAVSAGTNIKVMEAMACGRPIVSTPAGCAGLDLADGADLLIRDGDAEFAAAVGVLLSDAELRAAIAAHARRTVENRFAWTAIAEAAWRSYGELLRTP
ncbi:MAG: glycosyltransferase family 4 protein [Acidobacteria bacterium]|nr:glycosyltransferase family 4 protein [Acidobacteriota bacterium]